MKFLCSLDIASEVPCSSSALSALTAAVASNTIANGNNPQTWNFAQTTDSQAGLTFGETSAATGGTISNNLANQSEHSITTAGNSTATAFNITQGSITNTVPTPLAQFQATYNNSGLHARGFGISITNTASHADSLPLFINVGNSTLFAVDKTGMGVFNGNGAIGSTPPPTAASTYGWKYCTYSTAYCIGTENQTEYHLIASGGNAWFSLSGTIPNNNAGSGSPDSASGFSFHNAVFMMMGKGHAGCGFTNISASAFICGNSSTGEFSAATAGSSSLGMLVRSQPSPISVTGATGAVTNGTVLCAASAGACNVAGFYRVSAYFDSTVTCATPGPAAIGFNVTFTDEIGTKTAQTVPLDVNGATSVTATMPLGDTTTNATATTSFWSTGASAIGYGVTYTACTSGSGTFARRIAVERVF